MKTKIIIALAILMGLVRPFIGQRHGFTIDASYEALAHIVVGMLIACWIVCDNKKRFWSVLVLITIIEILCSLRK